MMSNKLYPKPIMKHMNILGEINQIHLKRTNFTYSKREGEIQFNENLDKSS
jgi:hypothetical protein